VRRLASLRMLGCFQSIVDSSTIEKLLRNC
jgi:hypothetical protein